MNNIYCIDNIVIDVDRRPARSSPKTCLSTEAGGEVEVEGQFSRCEASPTGPNTLPLSLPLSLPLPTNIPDDVPLTAVDADRIAQSKYLSPYCTEISIRYYFILLHFATIIYLSLFDVDLLFFELIYDFHQFQISFELTP